MKAKSSGNFLVGLTIGVLVGVIFWYWQKSTSAEDGALALLDRLATAENKLSQPRAGWFRRPAHLAVAPEPSPDVPVDLQRVRGIGPVYDKRLREAGILTMSQLEATSEDRLAEILQVNSHRAANILREVRIGTG